MNRFVNDLRKVPVLKILLPFLTGLLCSEIFSDRSPGMLTFIPVVSITLFCFFYKIILKRRGEVPGWMLAVCFWFFFMTTGRLYAFYLEPIDPQIAENEFAMVSGTLTESPGERLNSYAVTMITDSWFMDDSVFRCKLKLLIYFSKEQDFPDMKAGEKWLLAGTVRKISNPGNPFEFDYEGYMHRRGYWHSLFLRKGSLVKISGAKRFSFRNLPDIVARRIRSGWDLHQTGMTIVNAVTLGDKQMLSREVRSAFSESGAMHLLAVSGLHVGMIWWLLDVIIRLPRGKRIFRFLKVVIILCILWIYAGITGFSESVTRSVTMFSIISISKTISRNPNIYNTLFLSAMILLVIKPDRVYEAGFQLSYLAVFGIVTIQPLLSSVLLFKRKILRGAGELVKVSIAAQLSTFPLTIFLFNSFPAYFIITNLIAIPLVSALLAIFVFSVPFLITGFYSHIFLSILQFVANLLYRFVSFISSLPGGTIINIPMTWQTTMLLMAIIFSLVGLWYYRRVKWLMLTLALVSLLLLSSGYNHRTNREQGNDVIIYNFKRCTAITLINSGKLSTFMLHSKDEVDPYVEDYLLKIPCKRGIPKDAMFLDCTTDLSVKEKSGPLVSLCEGAWALWDYGGSILICGDCSGERFNYLLDHYHWDMVLLRKGFPVLSDQNIKALQHAVVVADGTSYSSETGKLRAALSHIHITSEQGAFYLSEHLENRYR